MGIILVVGSTGKLGSHLVSKLISNSYTVIGIDLLPMKQPISKLNYQHFEADAAEVGNLKIIANSIKEAGMELTGIVNCFFHPEILDNVEKKFTGSRINQLDSAFRQYSDVSFANELSGNITAVHNVIRTFLPNDFNVDFSVVNVSSVYGVRQPNPQILDFSEKFLFKPPGYSVSKSGLIAYTEYLANLYAGTKFRFNSIAPGFIDAGQDSSFKTRFNDRLNIRRFATLEEIASPIEFLLSSGASYITGSTVVVDGGYSKT
jgi:NAD(P)-dependent dehydrogenase (short-subunit alcohol dehydrogenase family)